MSIFYLWNVAILQKYDCTGEINKRSNNKLQLPMIKYEVFMNEITALLGPNNGCRWLQSWLEPLLLWALHGCSLFFSVMWLKMKPERGEWKHTKLKNDSNQWNQKQFEINKERKKNRKSKNLQAKRNRQARLSVGGWRWTVVADSVSDNSGSWRAVRVFIFLWGNEDWLDPREIKYYYIITSNL